VFGGRTGQGAVATRSRSCGSREVFGGQLVVVAMWFRVGMSPLLRTVYDGGRRRCAIGLVEPALRQGGPVLTTRTWRYLGRPEYGGIDDWQVLLEAARTRVAAPHGLEVDSNLQLGVWPRLSPRTPLQSLGTSPHNCHCSGRHSCWSFNFTSRQPNIFSIVQPTPPLLFKPPRAFTSSL